MKELKANPNRNACGTVIEAKLDNKEGAKATFLVQNGTLRVGDYLAVGDKYCKVRKLTNEYDKSVKHAYPGAPVVVTGISEVPSSGDHFIVYQNEKETRDAISIIKQKNISKQTNEELLNLDSNSDLAHVFVIIKGDTQGSADVLNEMLSEIKVDGVKLHIVRSASGDVNESDVQLAINTDAYIICFNTGVNSIAQDLAKQKDVRIKNYDVVYNITDDVVAIMKKELKPVYIDVVYGRAEVRQLFKASKVGQIAGCMVIDGKIKSNSRCRVIRNNEVICEDHIQGLKRFKDDVKEVVKDFDCGITLSKYQKLELGDILESWGNEVDKNA